LARVKQQFVCQSCGGVSARWAGRCEACGEWNSIVEEAGESSGVGGGPAKSAAARGPKGRKIELVSMDGTGTEPARFKTNIGEFDRVTGGGLVPGSALLVGGVQDSKYVY